MRGKSQPNNKEVGNPGARHFAECLAVLWERRTAEKTDVQVQFLRLVRQVEGSVSLQLN